MRCIACTLRLVEAALNFVSITINLSSRRYAGKAWNFEGRSAMFCGGCSDILTSHHKKQE